MSGGIVVSVVVCVFNKEKLLEQCLESLDRQTFDGRQFEVLVIDDESDDRSFNIVKEFINRRVTASAFPGDPHQTWWPVSCSQCWHSRI